jgi:hypothetical protein
MSFGERIVKLHKKRQELIFKSISLQTLAPCLGPIAKDAGY